MSFNIFISYRRNDSEESAHRLSDDLASEFGKQNIFIDVRMRAGQHIKHTLIQKIESSSVVLVVIGKRFLSQRLFEPEDWVRFEIAHALESGKKVIPVLINQATMPGRTDLPDDLKPMAGINAAKLESKNWPKSFSELSLTISAYKNEQEALSPNESQPPKEDNPTLRHWKKWLASLIFLIILGVLIWNIIPDKQEPVPEHVQPLVDIHGKYGLKKGGQAILPPLYESISAFSEGLAIVQKNEQFGYVDTLGKFSTPIVFDSASPFNGGIARVSRGGQEYFIDRNGICMSQCPSKELPLDAPPTPAFPPQIWEVQTELMDLEGRAVKNSPPIRSSFTLPGKVRLKLCINSDGRVTQAEYTMSGSTTSDGGLIRLAINVAKQYQFEKIEKKMQCAFIAFTFSIYDAQQ